MLIRFRDRSGSVSLRHISEETDRHGNVRLYFRKRGSARIRLRAQPGTDEFMIEYRAALNGTTAATVSPSAPAAPGSLRWLVKEFKASAEFKDLHEDTRRMKTRQFDAILPKWGKGLVSELTPKYVKKIRDEAHRKPDEEPTPHAANNLVKSLRSLFGWAIDNEHMQTNPARDVKKIGTTGDGHHTWTVDEIHAYLAKHPWHTKAGLALALLLFFGVRRSDVVKLGRQMETLDGTLLRLVETKGADKKVKITDLPILTMLRQVLDQHPGKMTYLLTQADRPFTANGFGNWFKDRCREANLNHCSAHGLRKAGATIAADNGATEHQLMALYGWTTPAQAAHYTKRANRKRMAEDAARLVEGDQKLNVGTAEPKTNAKSSA
jgi:integrase